MSKDRTESVERALSILEAFSSDRPGLTLAGLARETGLHKSTILRLANSLTIYGFLRRDAQGVFRPGPSLWRLGSLYRRDFDSGDLIRPELRGLVAATGETATFYVRAGDERICLYRENSPHLARYHIEEGTRFGLEHGAAGRVLRAIGTGGRFLAADGMTAKGSCVSVGERNPYIASVATPVHSASGEARGAIAVSGLVERFGEAARRAAIPLLEAAAERLRARL